MAISYFRANLFHKSTQSCVRQVYAGAPWNSAGVRYTSTTSAPKSNTRDVRNLAVVAHIDSGKTTLTESILARSGYLSAAGTVDTGSTTTDFLPAERERGITIQSASIPVHWRNWTFNLIDTPGHADFGMEVESASRVVDGAVVLIDSVEGVESQTQGVWKQLERYNVPSRMLFLNKMDRPGASFRASLQSILNYRLHPRPLVITLPIASFDSSAYSSAEPGIEGIVDLIRWELWRWNTSSDDPASNFSRTPLPTDPEVLQRCSLLPDDHPLRDELISARRTMLDNLAMFSDQLMDELLELPDPSAYASVAADRVIPALREAVIRRDVLPVLCGSAMKHIGTDLVLDYVGLLLANPLDVPGALELTSSPEVQMLAWKVAWDKRRGWMTFVRIYSGTLTKQSALLNVSRNQKEKVSKLLLLYANQPEEVDTLTFGNVGVILGLKHTRTGDTLVATGSQYAGRSKQHEPTHAGSGSLKGIVPPPAVMSSSIIPQSTADLQPVTDALNALTRTDPSARVEAIEGQLLVHGLGSLHLEIIESRLRDEWGVAFETGHRRVTYRETLDAGHAVAHSETWTTEYHGRAVEVQMDLDVQALDPEEAGDPQWDGNIVLNSGDKPISAPEISSHANTKDNRDPWTFVAQGLSSSLLSSPHSGLPYSRLRIKVKSFEMTPEDSSIAVLAGAASFALRRTLQKTGRGPIMEPYVRLRVSVGEDHIGRIFKDLTENSGEILDLGDQSSETFTGEDGIPFSEDGVYIPPLWMSPSAFIGKGDHGGLHLKRSIHALAPLSRMLDFNNRLRALSGGHGTFEMSSTGFRVVNKTREIEILRELGRA